MAFEDLKSRYLKYYRESPVMMLFLTVMSASLLVTFILSAVSRDYLMSILGKMAQHVFMDHFWSAADCMVRPYTDLHVIYPPLAVSVYAFIGRYTLPFVDHSTSDLALDMYNSQLPMMVFALLYAIGIFLFLSVIDYLLSGNARKWQVKLVVLVILLSSPVVIGIQNGNNIIFVTSLILLFLKGYNSETKWVRYLSYAVLGVVAGFKPLPAILGLLILRERRYSEFLLCVCIVAVISLTPIVFVGDSLSVWIGNLTSISEELGGSINNISKFFGSLSDEMGIPWLRTVGTILIIIQVALTAIIILFDRDMVFWKLLALIGCLLILGPGVGTPYLYIYLIPALLFLIITEKTLSTSTVIFTILLMIPLIPFSLDLIIIKLFTTFLLIVMLMYQGILDIFTLYRNENK